MNKVDEKYREQLNALQEAVKGLAAKVQELEDCQNEDLSQIVYIQVKDDEKYESFMNAIFDERIHHEAYSEYVFSMALRDKKKLENLGYNLLEAEPPKRFSDRPAHERARIKREALEGARVARRETVEIIRNYKKD